MSPRIDAPEEIQLGIRGERVPVGSHIAYLWESEEEFEESIGFLRAGIRRGDHCVIFGHQEANPKVLASLKADGLDPEALRKEGRLSVLGGSSTGDEILQTIGETFQNAVERGSGLIRLLGNIGWGHDRWPGKKDLLRFEARVTDAAAAFPCIVVCNYEITSLGGDIILHGAFQTHPLTFCRNLVRENPHYCGVEEFLDRHGE